MMPGQPTPTPSISDTDLTTCINLVKAVSDRANTHDFMNVPTAIGLIHQRGGDNGWNTWLHRNATTGNIDACCFFQYMRSMAQGSSIPYAMCVGFDENVFPMQKYPDDCENFVNTVAGGVDGDGLLHDFIKNVLNVQFVYVVYLPPPTAAAAFYNEQLTNLFHYAQSNRGANWSMASVANGSVNLPFWGGNGLSLYKLNIT
jgi:hypothetical protein